VIEERGRGGALQIHTYRYLVDSMLLLLFLLRAMARKHDGRYMYPLLGFVVLSYILFTGIHALFISHLHPQIFDTTGQVHAVRARGI